MNKDLPLQNHIVHLKSRTQKHASYPDRFWVSDEKVGWDIEFPEYRPVNYTSPKVLDPSTPWADPADVAKIRSRFSSAIRTDSSGFPLNPVGRTGICGRGVIGKWGPNFAADGLITTINTQGKILVLAITRSDTGEYAIPGGMVDPGEAPIATRNRELEEEISLSVDDLKNPDFENIIYIGYGDDPRNTDNAWMETTVFHSHFNFEAASKMQPTAGDDAVDFSWLELSYESISKFFASHPYFLMLALANLKKHGIS